MSTTTTTTSDCRIVIPNVVSHINMCCISPQNWKGFIKNLLNVNNNNKSLQSFDTKCCKVIMLNIRECNILHLFEAPDFDPLIFI